MLKAQSTHVENALPSGERNPNRHHNVPQSRAGSNAENNVSSVAITRHDDFHQSWGSNALPTELLRFVAIHAIGHPDKRRRLDASQVRSIFDATHAPNWSEYYYDDAMTSAAEPHGVIRSLQNLRTTANFLSQEKVWVNDTVSAIRGEGGQFPIDAHTLLPNAMKFFGTKLPVSAIREFLDEKNEGHYSWTKPLRHQKRSQLQALLGQTVETPSNNRREYVHLLLDHHKTLDLQAREIERTIAKLTNELQKLLQWNVVRPLDAA